MQANYRNPKSLHKDTKCESLHEFVNASTTMHSQQYWQHDFTRWDFSELWKYVTPSSGLWSKAMHVPTFADCKIAKAEAFRQSRKSAMPLGVSWHAWIHWQLRQARMVSKTYSAIHCMEPFTWNEGVIDLHHWVSCFRSKDKQCPIVILGQTRRTSKLLLWSRSTNL